MAAFKPTATLPKITFGFFLALIILTVPLPLTNAQPVERHFRIEASQFAYSPGVLRVNPGDQVTIELVATDVVHGMYIDNYELQTSADPGQTATIELYCRPTGSIPFPLYRALRSTASVHAG